LNRNQLGFFFFNLSSVISIRIPEFSTSPPYFVVGYICIFAYLYLLYHSAKALRGFELKRVPKFRELLADMICIYLFPVGVWVVQPRVREYFMEGTKPANVE
jgi:hypothetical protein